MICPNCGSANDDDAAICSACDHILDLSFLGNDFTGADGEGGDQPADEAALLAAVAAEISVDPGDESGDESDQAGFAPGEEPTMVRPSASAAPAVRGPSPAASEPHRHSAESTDPVVAALQAFQRLDLSDRVVVGCAGLAFLLSFFPWLNVPRMGTVVGLSAGGWPVIPLAAGLVAAIWLREPLAQRVPWLPWVQVGLGATIALVALAGRGALAEFLPEDVSRLAASRELAAAGSTVWLWLTVLAGLAGALVSLLQAIRSSSAGGGS